PVVSPENSLPPDRHRADHALPEGLDASAAERVAGLSTSHHYQPFCPVRASTCTPCTSASSSISTSSTYSWMNSEPGCGAPHRSVFLWLAIDPLTRDSSCASARPPNTNHGACTHPLAPTEPGSKLPSALYG